MKEGGGGRPAGSPSLPPTHAHTSKRGEEGEGTKFEKWSRNEKEELLDLGRRTLFFLKRKESSGDNALSFTLSKTR